MKTKEYILTFLGIVAYIAATIGAVAFYNHINPIYGTKEPNKKESSVNSDSSTSSSTKTKPNSIPVNLPGPFIVHPGGSAWLVAGTSPGVSCAIVVEYKPDPSHSAGLENKHADNEGNVRWDWNVGTNTTPGMWPVEVACQDEDGMIGSASTQIIVR